MSTKSWLLIFIITAAFLRITYVSLHNPIPQPYQVNLDEIDFNYLGKSISEGRGFTDKYGEPTTTRFPLYPCFIAVIYYIFGYHIYFVFLAQALIGASMPVMAYFTAKEFFDRKIALLAAGVTAVYPYYIEYTGKLMSENLFIPLLALVILFAVKLGKNPTVKNAGLLGFFLSVSFLTRGVVLPMMLISPFIVYFLAKGKFAGKLKITLAFIAAFALTLTPWGIRNYHKYNKFFVSSSEGWPVMWMSYFPIPAGEFFKMDRAYAYVDSAGEDNARYETFNDILAEDNYFGVTGIRWYFQKLYPGEYIPEQEMELGLKIKELLIARLKADPAIFVVKHIKESLRFWHFVDDRGDYVLGYGIILLFFFAGLWMLRKRLLKEFWLLLLFFVYIWIMETAFQSAARYRLPFEVVMIVIGSYALWAMFTKLKPLAFPLVIMACLIGINIYFSENDFAFRKTVRFFAKQVGFKVLEKSDAYFPTLEDGSRMNDTPADTISGKE